MPNETTETGEVKPDVETTVETTETGTDDVDTKKVENTIDYEAELRKERDAREKAERALADDRFKSSQRKRREIEDDDQEDISDKPLTRSELEEVLQRDRQLNQKQIRQSRIEEIAKGMSRSDAEKSLIIEIHKNRVWPNSVPLEEQLEESYAIANRKKIIGERDEALRALRGKTNASVDTATTYRDSPKQSGEIKLSGQDMSAIREAGYTFNTTSRRFEKKLPNGKTLIYDVKTKNSRLI